MNYNHTRMAAYISFLSTSLVVSLVPLLLVPFSEEFGVSLIELGVLVSVNSIIQVIFVMIVSMIAERVGYRLLTVLMNVLVMIGIAGIGVFPYLAQNPFNGLLLATIIYSLGNAIIETVNNPIVESLPSDHKETELSLLHSVFSWGQVLVIGLSTLYFVVFGTNNWRYLPLIWAIIPIIAAVLYARVPLPNVVEEGQKEPIKEIATHKAFIIIVIMMLIIGPLELAVSSWASFFAEQGLGVSKTVGDLLGPGLFAVGMGSARVFYGFKGQNWDLRNAMSFSVIGVFVSYMIVVFSPVPLGSLIGFGLAGIFNGIMWPGALSIAGSRFRRGGTMMMGFLTVAGYLGSTLGSIGIGAITESVEINAPAWAQTLFTASTPTELGLKTAIFFFGIVTVVLFGALQLSKREVRSQTSEKMVGSNVQ